MKPVKIIPLLVAMVFAGCEYEAPLTKDHTIPIDPAILGLWETPPSDKKTDEDPQQLLVLRFSETEYLIQHPNKKDGIRYRAYPIEVGGVSCVQLEAIGTGDEPVDQNDPDRFHVVAYEIKDARLTIRTLNTELIDDALETSEQLRAAFLKHKDDPTLFKDPATYIRTKE